MDPTSNESAGLQFPMPEQTPDLTGVGEAQPEPGLAAPERAPAPAERAPSTGQAPAVPQSPIALPLPPAPMPAVPQDDTAATTQTVTAAIADDGDLIEKEWVSKAKHIVESTRNDPYKQSEQLTEFKAEYMKKRYGKDIKLSK